NSDTNWRILFTSDTFKISNVCIDLSMITGIDYARGNYLYYLYIYLGLYKSFSIAVNTLKDHYSNSGIITMERNATNDLIIKLLYHVENFSILYNHFLYSRRNQHNLKLIVNKNNSRLILNLRKGTFEYCKYKLKNLAFIQIVELLMYIDYNDV